MDLFEEVKIEADAADALARGLCTIAEVDGMHKTERELIERFWKDTTKGAAPLLALSDREPITAADLADKLKTSAERRLFFKTAVLLMWADGEVSPEENQSVREFAHALGLDSDDMAALEDAVMEYLGANLTHFENSETARIIGEKLKK
jgi:tellurite resistance protein